MSIRSSDTPVYIMGKPIKGGLPGAGEILQFNAVGDYWESVALPPSAPHDLLDGVVDQDTVAHAVAAGDLIFGNATPKWDGLAKGAAGALLQISAANLPAWLAPGTNGYLLVMVAGAPAWVSFGASSGYLKGGDPPTLQTGIPLADLLNAGGAAGDVIYWDGANFIRLPVGSNGAVLTLVAGVPAWRSATKQTAVNAGNQTTASAAFVDVTGLSLNLPNTGKPALISVTLTYDFTAAGTMEMCVSDNAVDQTGQATQNQPQGSNQASTTLTYVTICSGQVVKARVRSVGANDLNLYGTAGSGFCHIDSLEL